MMYDGGMKEFIDRHQRKIKGVLSCFDRMIFRGYLPVQNGQGMAGFLKVLNIPRGQLKTFLLENSGAVISHAKAMAEKEGRPYRYLEQKLPMEQEARKIAARDGIEEGLVCIFAILEPCRTFSFTYAKDSDFIRPRRTKCLHLYYYFLDREFGLIHLKLQTWFPLTMQVYVNGQERLARKLKEEGIGFTKLDNVFIGLENFERAQALADGMTSLNWPGILERWTRRINPLMNGVLKNMRYYWATAQCEYATDVIFQSRRALQDLYPRLLSHGLLAS